MFLYIHELSYYNLQSNPVLIYPKFINLHIYFEHFTYLIYGTDFMRDLRSKIITHVMYTKSMERKTIFLILCSVNGQKNEYL